MARPKLYHPDQPFAVRVILRLYEFLASLKLAVVLIFTLATVLGIATLVESNVGTEAAQFYIYHTRSFAALLALLAVNIFCAAAIRYPWKRHQTGFVITHLGLLTLLAGSAVSFRSSVNSQLLVFLDDSSNMAIDQDYGFLVFENLPGRPETLTVPFRPGPFNWSDLEPYPVNRWLQSFFNDDDLSEPWKHPPELLYEHEGTKVEIVDFYARSEIRQLPFVDLEFVNRGIDAEIPVELEFTEFTGGGFKAGFAREDFMGLGSVVFWQASPRTERKAFLECIPQTAIDGDGAIVVWDDGEVYQINIAELEQRKADGEPYRLESGHQIELVDYRSARISPPNQQVLEEFPWLYLDQTEQGLIPYGPYAELRITPSGADPVEVTRLAETPFYDAGDLPDRFRVEFYHPKVKGRIDVLELADLSLVCRVWQQKLGRVIASQSIAVGDAIDTWSTGGDDRVWTMNVRRYEPRRDAEPRSRTFNVSVFNSESRKTEVKPLERTSWLAPLPLEFDKDDRGETRQVKIRVSWNESGETKADEFWLRQTLPPPWMSVEAAQVHQTDLPDDGPIMSSYKVKETDVGFTVKLVDFDLDVDPGTSMAANYTSHLIQVDVRDDNELLEMRSQLADSEDPEARQKLREQILARTEQLTAEKLAAVDGVSEDKLKRIVEQDPAISDRIVTMNEPLDYPDWRGRNLRLFQENYLPPNAMSGRSELGSIFRVNYDPGRSIKYLGSLLITLGIFTMFYMRAYFFKGTRTAATAVESSANEVQQDVPEVEKVLS